MSERSEGRVADGQWGGLLSTVVTSDEQKIRRHQAEVAYHNSRMLEEAVMRAPVGLDRAALRKALAPVCADRNAAGGHVPPEVLQEIIGGIARYELGKA